MADLVRGLGEGLSIERGVRVGRLSRDGAGWSAQLIREGAAPGSSMPFDAVVSTLPAPQVMALFGEEPECVDAKVLAELGRVAFDPCLVLMARCEAPPPPWRAIASTSDPLQWVGVESSKRPGSGLCLTLHGSGPWSRERFDAPQDAVAAEMLAALRTMTPMPPGPVRWQLKRWRYARPTLLATARALLSESPPIVFCGDWAVAPRAEGAWLSGLAAAERLIGAGWA